MKKLNGFRVSAKRYGLWAAVRQAKNLGISFEDAYIGFFSREPRKLKGGNERAGS